MSAFRPASVLLLLAGALLLTASALTTPLVAQQESAPPGGDPVSPRGAFVRSLIVPGWGHAATGSYTRGGFYFLAQAGTAWMLVKTASRRSAARELRDVHADVAEARLTAQGLPPDSVQALVERDPAVEDAEALLASRSQQFEDWAAVGIFTILIGAADAYVAGHLQDFPAPLSIRALPAGPNGVAPARAGSSAGLVGGVGRVGGVELMLSIPWRGPGSGR